MNSKITKILVIGAQGEGKSTFCNYILDEKRIKNDPLHVPDIRLYVPNQNSKNSDIFVIDTDLDDVLESVTDQVDIDRIRKLLSEEYCNGIKSIIIMVNVNIPRLSQEAKRKIEIFCKFFYILNFCIMLLLLFLFVMNVSQKRN